MNTQKKTAALASTLSGSKAHPPIFVLAGVLFTEVASFSDRGAERPLAWVKRPSE